MFLAPRHRAGRVRVTCDGTSTLGHYVESFGVPLTEVGALRVGTPPGGTRPAGGAARPVPPGHRLAGGETVTVCAMTRPQPLAEARFLLDVHLGTLARRLRLLGIDTAYANDRDDDTLIEEANAGHRVLLTRDRGLLCRRRLWLGAYVRGDDPDDQLRDVLDRFAPPLAPWTRCTACNGTLEPVPKTDVEALLEPGTRRTYDSFARCAACDRVYWRGAHGGRLAAIVDSAEEIVAASRAGSRGTVLPGLPLPNRCPAARRPGTWAIWPVATAMSSARRAVTACGRWPRRTAARVPGRGRPAQDANSWAERRQALAVPCRRRTGSPPRGCGR